MAKPEKDDGLPIGIQPAPGKMRRVPKADRIAARVARFKRTDVVREATGVMKLNPGFFELERMRAGSGAKKRAKVRAKVRGK